MLMRQTQVRQASIGAGLVRLQVVAHLSGSPRRSVHNERRVFMTEEKTPAIVQPWQINVVIALLTLLIIIAAAHAWKSYQIPPQAKWEYMLGSESDATLNDTINKLGAEGWELVFARRASGNLESAKPDFRYEMIFRRPVNYGKPVFSIKMP
jgi:hypothetical protein